MLGNGFSIIIPMYNEAGNVSPLIEEIDLALSSLNHPYEIIVIDDCSTDSTYQELQNQHSPNLRTIRHKTNYGQSAALVTGARHAQYPWLITLDGDGQNDPADIPKIISVLNAQPKNDTGYLIAGNRAKRQDSFLRKCSSRIANSIRQSLLQDECLDTGCSLKCFPRDAFLQVPHFKHLHRYLPALFKRQGVTIVNVKVNHRPRVRGVSKYGVGNRLWVGIMDILGMRWLMRRVCNPQVYHD